MILQGGGGLWVAAWIRVVPGEGVMRKSQKDLRPHGFLWFSPLPNSFGLWSSPHNAWPQPLADSIGTPLCVQCIG